MKIAIIGTGNLGSSIAKGLINNKSFTSLYLADKNTALTAKEKELKDLKDEAVKKEVQDLLDKGKADKKLTTELATELADSFAGNPAGLKKVIDAMPFVTQIAFGVDAQCTSNPYTFEIMKYAREKGIVPNVTVADISDNTADFLATTCGAVAVSRYANKDF